MNVQRPDYRGQFQNALLTASSRFSQALDAERENRLRDAREEREKKTFEQAMKLAPFEEQRAKSAAEAAQTSAAAGKISLGEAERAQGMQKQLDEVQAIPTGIRNVDKEFEIMDRLAGKPVGFHKQAEGERQTKLGREAEAHTSAMETAKAQREAGRYSPITLKGGNIGRWNTKTGTVEDTGARAEQKPSGKLGVVKEGGILVPGFRPMENVEITKDSVQKVKGAAAAVADVKRQLADLRSAYKESGPAMLGEQAARLSSLVKQLQTTIKGEQFQNLGVIQKADLPFIEAMVADPTRVNLETAQARLARRSEGVGDPVSARFDELEKYFDTKIAAMARANGFEPEAAPTSGGGSAGPSSGLDRNDPKVKAALAAGYSEEEIRAYLGGGR